MTTGQYSFCLQLNADWLIQISEGLAVCKDGSTQTVVSTQMSTSATSQISSGPQLNVVQPKRTNVLALCQHSQFHAEADRNN